MMATTEIRNEGWLTDIETLIKARCPLIELTSFEEGRIASELSRLASQLKQSFRTWTRTKGFCVTEGKSDASITDPIAALRFVEECKEATIFLMKDFNAYLKDPTVARMVRDLSALLKTTHKSVIFLSPTPIASPELSRDLMNVEVPLPDAAGVRRIMLDVLSSLNRDPSKLDLTELVSAALGLTQDEIENVIARSLVKYGEIDLRSILYEKKAIVKKSGIMDFIELRDSLEGVGGLDRLKEWVSRRKEGFSQEARDLQLPAPRGILLVGVPGCGKSLTARAIGATWNLPIIRLDVGRVFAGLVGASENNMRMAIATAEAVAPCVLWIDEVEKAFAGTRNGGGGDSGTALRVFGTFLTWMQEKEKPVFVVATANQISALPPEFLRKGRFDEIFFVDLPSAEERKTILELQLKRRNWSCADLELPRFLEKSEGFTGAEIEQAIISGRYEAFCQKTDLAFDHLIRALSETVPLSSTMRDDISALRAWARNRAVFASTPEVIKESAVSTPRRTLNLEKECPTLPS